MSKIKKQNKVKKYIILAKANPIQAYSDLINLFLILVIFTIAFYFITWLEGVFQGTLYANPIMLKVGDISIYWRGVLMALAILIGALYVGLKNKKTGIKNEYVAAIIFWTILLGIIGGRIAFILTNWNLCPQSTLQIMNIWEGGISFYGSLLAGFLAVIAYSALRKINTRKVLDLFSPALFLGLTIGSWGGLFGLEKIGKPTDSFLRMYAEPLNRSWLYQKFSYFHPIFLYESAIFLLIFIALVVIKKKKKLENGSLFALAVLFYSLASFLLGFLNAEKGLIWVFNLAQVTGIIFIIIALTSLYLLSTKKEVKK